MLKFHNIRLTIPGRIVHFTRTHRGVCFCVCDVVTSIFSSLMFLNHLANTIEHACCGNKMICEAVVKSRDDFGHIVLSSTMGSDHLPDKYFYEITAALEFALKRSSII
jgi:hypothetical protein